MATPDPPDILTALKKQKRLRAAKKANLTKLSNEIRSFMTESPDVETFDSVDKRHQVYENALSEVREANRAYIAMLTDEEDVDDAETYMISIEKLATELLGDVSAWLGRHKPEDPAVEVRPSDSASQIGSVRSSVVSARTKAAAKKASLAVKAAMLKKRQELEQAELQINQQKEELSLETELAMAEAEEKIYAKSEVQGFNSSVHPNGDTKDNSKENKEDMTEAHLDPRAPEFLPNGIGVTQPQLVTQAIQQQQSQILEAIHLPRAELQYFDGDPLKYWSFIRAFHNTVDNSNLNDSAKLTRLIQYCRGRAAKVIECCSIMDPKEGYSKALHMLRDRFGDNHLIAEAWLESITQGGIIPSNDKQGLRDFADNLRGCKETLNSMGYLSELNNQKVLVSIAERLPNYLRGRWVREARGLKKRLGRVPTIVDLVEFVNDAAEEANDPVYGKLSFRTTPKEKTQSTVFKNEKPRFKGTGSNFNLITGTDKGNCLKCNKVNHSLFGCDEFKAMRPNERFLFARERQLCFNCLKVGHRANSCNLNRTCSIAGCGKKHTKFLHQASLKPVATVTVDNESPASDESTAHSGFATDATETLCASNGAGNTRVALPIVAVKVYCDGGNHCVSTYALLDTGSTSSFCTGELIRKLGIVGTEHTLSLTTLNSKSSITKTSVVSLEVRSVDNTYSVNMPVVYSKSEIPIRNENIARCEELKQWSHLCDLDLPQVAPDQVGLLIGQDVPEALVPLEVRVGSSGEPYATRTNLGWTVSGPMGCSQNNHAVSHFVSSEQDMGLEFQLKKFWKIDSSDTLVHDINEMSVEDKRAMGIWEETIKYRDGHYELAIPFRRRPVDLPNNREVAGHRLQSLGKRLKGDPELHAKYCKTMEEVIDKGYAHPVPPDELEGIKGSVWYLPHHPVVHPMKPDKVRIVYDCASKFNDTSLNDNVLQGPDLTNKLLGVLLRFRVGRVAFMADIESMFYQVRVSPSDWDVLRFLWWPNGDMGKEPKAYRMGVHIFGGTWSPSCCNFALQQTAEDHHNEFQGDTIHTVRRNFYVDDCLKSVDSEDKATELYFELRDLLRKGGFRLTKWVTNSVRMLNCIPDDDRASNIKGIEFNREALPAERALGVYWDVSKDSFGYKINLKDKPLTRRGLLSTVSSIYDPLGFACPITIKAKTIIQDLCRMQLGWDDPLPIEQLASWLNWKKDLPKLDTFKVDRCLNPKGEGRVFRCELHHFSDASEKAYGAVSYIRLVYLDGTINCGIVMAKAHLAPIKRATIPRLELTAATLSVKLDVMIRRELDIQIHESTFWTDSTIVLQYISNEEKRFKTFVANRISFIHSGSSPSQWRHVPTKLNPADIVSRGMTPDELINNRAWCLGPDFLWGNMENWPQQPKLPVFDQELEVKVSKIKVESYQVIQEGADVLQRLFERRSDWHKLKKDVAWLLRFKCYLKSKVNEEIKCDVSQSLSINELGLAEEVIVKYIQHQSFGKYMTAKSGNKVDKSSPLYKLDPQLSKSGVLYVGGRLCNAPLSEGMKHPLILPKEGHVVTLIIRHIHEQNGHVGREHVLSLLHERFWVVGARLVVRKVLRDCFVCKRAKSPLVKQKMADLPLDRVKPDMPPFSYIGVDYFGPFKVRRGRSEVKRYGCIFTCLVVRAIHIEISHSLDTDSFINALQRFIARRGEPIEIRCDNGSNFVGAERELKDTIRSWNQQKLEEFLKQKMILWKFNTPLASHMGGVWERLIRTTRKVLCSLTREQVLDDERLLTLMCNVESIVNSRPLTCVSDDTRDPEPLSPNHLLLLRPGSSFPADVFDKKDMYCKRRWRQVQYLSKIFWHRWVREYLVLLQQRQKWVECERNLKSGDIVLVVEEELPRNKWVLGRVVETFPGKDNLVRSVKIRTKNTYLIRPVRKLCLLEAIERFESRP